MPRPSRLHAWLLAAGVGLSFGVLAAPAYARAAAPARQPAARQLPLGTDGLGVYVHVARGRVSFSFAKRAAAIYDEIAGRRVQVGCTVLLETIASGYAVDSSASTQTLVAPRRRKPVTATIGRGRFDYCTVSIAGSARAKPTEVAAVPVSRRGAAYLDELQTARNVLGIASLTGVTPPRLPPSAARVRQMTHGRVVSLRGPYLIPPAGKIGYWTDGRATIYVAELTFYGALFFYEEDLDNGLVVTNLLGWTAGQG